MENNKTEKNSGSTSSITSQLFGSQASSSSTDIFASIFTPKEVGRTYVCSEVRGSWQKEHSGSGNQPWNSKQENAKHGDTSHNKEKDPIYQQDGPFPCNLSSSLYYGGQDMYSKPPTNSSLYSTYKKDGEEDDLSGASRGNWWEGSLYY